MGRSCLLPLSLPTSSPVVIIKFSFFSVSISTLQSIFYNLLANNSTNYFILFINSILNYLFYYCYSFRFFFYFSIFRYPNVFIITIFFPHAINIVLINILNTINMYVKKLLKKLTVDYIRHTKSKTGYVSEKQCFCFRHTFLCQMFWKFRIQPAIQILNIFKKLFYNIIKFNNKDFLFIPRNRFTIFYINIILYDIF